MERSAQRLLVVEDDVTVARALSRALSRRGFSVALAASCAAARALLQTFEFAIVDLDLPDGNGVDLARQLIRGGRTLGVVFFTGSTDAARLTRARRVGPVVAKSAGTSALLPFLPSEVSEPPESRIAPSTNQRGARRSSSVVARTSPSTLRKLPAR